jgi:cystathionine beta-lyase
MRPRTKLVEGGRRKEWRGRLVNPPVERASTILFDTVAELHSSKAKLGSYRYGLQGTATHWALSEALTELEPGAAGTALFSSGLAAISTAILALVEPGDELLVTDAAYWPTRRLCDVFLKRFGVTTRYYDPLIGARISDLLTDQTRAILLESPGSMTMEVQDVPAICEVARKRGIATILDNTWATPLFFPAHAAGVDISILAATKYVGGHADVMLGTVSATPDYFDRVQHAAWWDFGHAVSPDDAWLGSRGLRTMAVRLKQHEESALHVARWLEEQAGVGRVLHPALRDCPGHEIWKRDFKGSSGLFAFELRGDDARRNSLVESLELFGIGFSWGGYESLAIPVDPGRTATEPPAHNLVRLHIGLEDPDDLIADLAQAFDRLERLG